MSNQHHTELAGRQDDFCLICGDTEQELFPQLAPKEIHLCPRRFCNKCYHIEPDWKKTSSRFKSDVYSTHEYVTLCCCLCWKRDWDFSNPLLGKDQLEWRAQTKDDAEDALRRRYRYWEDCAVSKDFEPLFKWRLPLLELHDDMSLESDRKLVRTMGIKNGRVKNAHRFSQFARRTIRHNALSPRPSFNVGEAFADIKRVLFQCITLPTMADAMDEWQERQERHKEEQDEEEDEEGNEHDGQPSPQNVLSRPQRQASRLSFVTGKPIRQEMSTPDENLTNEEPNDDHEMADPPIGGSVASVPSISHVGKSLRVRTSPNHTPRPRGRPPKIPRASNAFPPSPSTQDDTALGPPFVQDRVFDDAEPEQDKLLDQMETIVRRMRRDEKRVQEHKSQQEAQFRHVKEELEESVRRLDQERLQSRGKETNLRNALSAASTDNVALQGAMADSKKQNKQHSQNITELNRKLTEQGKQIADDQCLRQVVEDHKRKLESLEADLEAAKAQEQILNDQIIDTRGTCDELEVKHNELKEEHARLKKKYRKLEQKNKVVCEENDNFSQAIARRIVENAELRAQLTKATGTPRNGTSNRIRHLVEGQDDVMDANKELRKDVAILAAELVLDRGVKEFARAGVQEALLARGSSLASDLVDRVMQNAFLEFQVAEKVRERELHGGRGGCGGPQESSQTNFAKRRRVEPSAEDINGRWWPRGDTELYD